MTLEGDLLNGDRAREVLENEAFQAAFEMIEKDLTDQWKQSPARDSDGRERIYLALGMLNKIKVSLTQTMQSGTLARVELEHKQKMSERLRDGMRKLASV